MKLKLFTLRMKQKQYLKRVGFYNINTVQIISFWKNVTLTKITQNYHMLNSN